MSLTDYKIMECLVDYLCLFDTWKVINSCKKIMQIKNIFKIPLPYRKIIMWYTIVFFNENGKFEIVPKSKCIDYDLINILQRIYNVDYLPFFNKLIRMKYGYRNTKKVMQRIHNHTEEIDICLLPCHLVYDMIECYYHIYNNKYILSYSMISKSIHNLDVFSDSELMRYSKVLVEWINTKKVKNDETKEKTLINCTLCVIISEIIFKTKFDRIFDISYLIETVLDKLLECRKIMYLEYMITCDELFDNLIFRFMNKYKSIKMMKKE